MRSLATLIICFSLFTPDFAHSARNKKKELRAINKVIKCSRNFIDKKKGGQDSVEIALVYLRRLREVKDDLHLIEELHKACKEEYRGTPSSRKVKWGEIQAQLDRLTDFPLNTRQVVSNFIDPRAMCEFRGIGFSLGVIVSIGLGFKVAVCSATNGKKFFAFAPKAEFGGGGGVNLYYNMKKWKIKLHRDNWDELPVDSDEQTSQGIGVMNTETDDQVNEQQRGIGAGYMVNQKFELAIKTIPLGNDFSFIRDILFKDNQ